MCKALPPPSHHLQFLLIVRRVGEEEAEHLSHAAGRKETDVATLVVQDEGLDEGGSDGREGRGQGTLNTVTLAHELLTGLQHVRKRQASKVKGQSSCSDSVGVFRRHENKPDLTFEWLFSV